MFSLNHQLEHQEVVAVEAATKANA